jgi:hypothetical protein
MSSIPGSCWIGEFSSNCLQPLHDVNFIAQIRKIGCNVGKQAQITATDISVWDHIAMLPLTHDMSWECLSLVREDTRIMLAPMTLNWTQRMSYQSLESLKWAGLALTILRVRIFHRQGAFEIFASATSKLLASESWEWGRRTPRSPPHLRYKSGRC